MKQKEVSIPFENHAKSAHQETRSMDLRITSLQQEQWQPE